MPRFVLVILKRMCSIIMSKLFRHLVTSHVVKV